MLYQHYSLIPIFLNNSRVASALFIAVNIIGFPLYYKNWVMVRKDMIEKRSKELALLPLMCAARERIELKRLKHLRKLEAEVMNDFPFWEVGTLFGVPIYESLPENEYIPITLFNYYLFSDINSPPALAMELFFK
ncbi:unnamed protein product [Xylocopa violacea]|uniref:NADH dehydrogenase [ubiquinone] 1 alpha subcomplex subunit 13 n=1 Tax=Xylocopa violacea TaxID=135666 RepID=A0ABP1NBV1_XYLVO